MTTESIVEPLASPAYHFAITPSLTLAVTREPKSSCRRCYGRGYTGVRVDLPRQRQFLICRCVGGVLGKVTTKPTEQAEAAHG